MRQIGRSDDPHVRVDVVDRATIDADRGHQPRIVAHAVQVVHDAVMVPKDGFSGVAAFDAAVKVVPMVEEADGGVRTLGEVQAGDRFMAGDFAQ